MYRPENIAHEIISHEREHRFPNIMGRDGSSGIFGNLDITPIRLPHPGSRYSYNIRTCIQRRSSGIPVNPFISFKGTDTSYLNELINDFAFDAVGQFIFVYNEFKIRTAIQDLKRESEANRIDLCGFSLGGAIAQHVACVYPDEIGKVITFQAPGTTQYYLGLRNSSLRNSYHVRMLGDVVHYAGERMLPGEIDYFEPPGEEGSLLARLIAIGIRVPSPVRLFTAAYQLYNFIDDIIEAHVALPLTQHHIHGEQGMIRVNNNSNRLLLNDRVREALNLLIENGRITRAVNFSEHHREYIRIWESIRDLVRQNNDGFTASQRSRLKRMIGERFNVANIPWYDVEMIPYSQSELSHLGAHMMNQLMQLYPNHFPEDQSQQRSSTSADSDDYPLGNYRREATARLEEMRINTEILGSRTVKTAIRLTLAAPVSVDNVLIQAFRSRSSLAGIAWQNDDPREVRIYTWNTSPITRSNNHGHAEQGFYKWLISAQNRPLLNAIRGIDIRNFERSPCSDCCRDLKNLTEKIERSQERTMGRVVLRNKHIFWKELHTGNNETFWQHLGWLHNKGWMLHAPYRAFPPEENHPSRLRGRLRWDNEYTRVRDARVLRPPSSE